MLIHRTPDQEAPLDPSDTTRTQAGARAGASDRTWPAEALVLESDAWHMREFASACGIEALSAHHRADVYYDRMWGGTDKATWPDDDDAGTYVAPRIRARMNRLTAAKAVDHIATAGRRRSPFPSTAYLSVLGAVHGWHTTTAEQLATLVGLPSLRSGDADPLLLAWQAGMLDRGYLVPTGRVRRDDVPVAFQLSKGSASWARLRARLSNMEVLAVTGGQPWGPGPRTDRHNVLVTELGLRIAEYAEVGAVLGERFASFDMLAGSGAGFHAYDGRSRADLVAVRPDGARVAVEVTCTNGKNLPAKVERWAALLATWPAQVTGLHVIFLVAAPPANRRRDDENYNVRTALHRAVWAACKKYPGTSLAPTAARIGVATWREWFPARHLMSEAFLQMRAHRPIGLGVRSRANSWDRSDFLGPDTGFPHPVEDRNHVRQVLEASQLLAQSPFWLRRNPDVAGAKTYLLGQYGLDRLRPGHGAVADTSLPDHLLGLAARGTVRPG